MTIGRKRAVKRNKFIKYARTMVTVSQAIRTLCSVVREYLFLCCMQVATFVQKIRVVPRTENAFTRGVPDHESTCRETRRQRAARGKVLHIEFCSMVCDFDSARDEIIV